MTRQKTIRRPVTLEGIGLQTGKKVTAHLKHAPADSGINFIRTDLANKPLIHIQSCSFEGVSKDRRTAVGFEGAAVETTEHLLASLSALSVDNIVIEIDSGELPGLDGSSKVFFDALKEAGIEEQDKAKQEIIIKEPLWFADNNSFIAVFPDKEFKVSYLLSYPDAGIDTQFLSVAVNEENFAAHIAPARTFCHEEEALLLLKQGFGKGATYENTLIIGKAGPLRTALRFPDEPVRHKILDLIGDLYLLGCRVQGHVVAVKSGHKQNMEIVKKIKENYRA